MDQIVVFLDLLGFTQVINDSSESAKSKMDAYESIIIMKKVNYEKSTYQSKDPQSIQLNEPNLATTFKYFIPTSDSIFISSDIDKKDTFILQLCHFLYNSYIVYSNKYENPQDIDEATKGDGLLAKRNYSPCLFRGGLSTGDCEPYKQSRIINNKISDDCCNLVGKAVEKAVHLEGIVDGPRIVIRKKDYDNFGNNIKSRYFREIEKNELKNPKVDETYYELLWPAIMFIKDNGIDREIHNLDSMLKGVYNLRKSKSNNGADRHYDAFMNLIYNSILTFWENEDKAKKHVDSLKEKYCTEKNVLNVIQKWWNKLKAII